MALPEIDLTDPDVYASRVPDREFAELRRQAPVWWNAQQSGAKGFGDGGFCAVTRHADVLEVPKNDKLFSSWQNTALIRFDDSVERDAIDMQRVIMLNTDPPHHTDMRLGAHYCLGAGLAKLEIELIFNAIADAMPDIHAVGTPERLRSGWINGIKRCPVAYR